MQLRVAAASAEIDCARMLIERDTREAMAAMREGRSLTLAERARNRRDMAFAARFCQRAVEGLFEAGGARSVYSASIPQRKFRDVRVAANPHRAQLGRGGDDLRARRLRPRPQLAADLTGLPLAGRLGYRRRGRRTRGSGRGGCAWLWTPEQVRGDGEG